jgi:hypothetical protein
VQPQPARGIGGLQRECQGRIARARTQDDVLHTPARQLVDDDVRLCCRRIHTPTLSDSGRQWGVAPLTVSTYLNLGFANQTHIAKRAKFVKPVERQLRTAEVVATKRISPNFVPVTLGGAGLAEFTR